VIGARATLLAAGLAAGTILTATLAAVPELRHPEPAEAA